MKNENDWSVKVREAASLEELIELLQAGSAADADDFDCWANLPVYGGPTPADTAGVWSWDSKRLLVGTCADDMEIVARED